MVYKESADLRTRTSDFRFFECTSISVGIFFVFFLFHLYEPNYFFNASVE